MVKSCERCKALPPKITSGAWAGQSQTHNYCVHCSEDLCEKCLAESKCLESPSGGHEVEPE